MDVLQVFNDELQSLVDMKPPVSKAKMGQITRAAMKGVKFYKHIVQSVEKFVARCSPEYKVPGLYVIDSIVRQSRHQFGIDRDVYASRFSRNLGITFENLFSDCAPDDKSKIVRVLNLWQKNGVFNPHVIQPLLDMASPTNSHQVDPKSPNSVENNSNRQAQTSSYDSNQYRNLSRQPIESNLKFDKDMLDFDYDEDDEDDGDETPTEAEPPLSSTLSKIEMEQRRKIDKANSALHQPSQRQSNSDQKRVSQQQPSQDPVLERWNRIIRLQTEPAESSNSNQHTLNSSRNPRRSRSRSPPLKHLRTSTQETSTDRLMSFATKDMSAASKITEEQATEPSPHDAERDAERERKCLPKVRDKHLTVCSSTLWLGHVPKTVTEADISDAFGEYGTINSIDLIPPRGCAYVCMDRRQDAKRALNESKDLKLNGSHIKMAWAPGKGFKEYKKLKDFWESDVGASFIPHSKVDESIDFDTLEEGGVIDEDSMSLEMRERRDKKTKGSTEKPHDIHSSSQTLTSTSLSLPMPVMPMLNQPPPPTSIQQFTIPPPNLNIPPPVGLGQGLIPFPPPGVMTTASSSGSIIVPRPPPNSTQPLGESSHDSEKSDTGSPLSLDQQLSMTERQISMVEQQLSMIQRAQGINQGQPISLMQGLPQQALFYQHNQPNPMSMFDLPPHQIHPGIPPMLDPQQLAMFMNNPLMNGQPMISMTQASMMDSENMGDMAQHQGGF